MRIRRTKSRFIFILNLVTKLRRSSRMKIFCYHLLVKFSCSISCQMRSKLSLIRIIGMCNISKIYPIANLSIHISRTWWFSKQLLVVTWTDEEPHNSQNKLQLNMWKQSMLYYVFSWSWWSIWITSRDIGMFFTSNSWWGNSVQLKKVPFHCSSIYWYDTEEEFGTVLWIFLQNKC